MKKVMNKKGFTLVEILLVVVIVAILAAVVIVAINPGRQIAQTNNTQRSSNVSTILNAIHEYAIDNRGTLPAGLGAVATVGSGVGQVDICALLVPTYVAEMPFDPTAANAHYTSCADYDTGYTAAVDANNRVTVAAPGAELNEVISVTR